MRELKTLIHDGFREEEIYETMEGLKQHRWSHSITLGVAGDTSTYGDVWMSIRKGVNELVRKDRNTRYAIWICKNIREDGSEGRPHAHGVIFTTLMKYQIDACFYSYHSYTCKAVTDEEQLEGWFRYFLPQSVRDAVLTNISNEEYE